MRAHSKTQGHARGSGRSSILGPETASLELDLHRIRKFRVEGWRKFP